MTPKTARKFYAYAATFVWLTVVWVLLWGNLNLGTIASGICIAIIVVIAFPLPGMEFSGRPNLWRIVLFVLKMGFELVVTSFQVVIQAITPGPRIKSAVIAVKLHTHNELILTLLAICVTLTPGTAIIEARRASGELYVHLLGVNDEKDLVDARYKILKLESQVINAIGSQREKERIKNLDLFSEAEAQAAFYLDLELKGQRNSDQRSGL